MKYKIEKNIPMPPKRLDKSKNLKYPWPDMEVGDSIYIAGHSGRQCGLDWAKRHNRKFEARVEAKGYRIWRVSDE